MTTTLTARMKRSLDPRLEKHLLKYVGAATGAALLAMPATAEIVYTPANTHVGSTLNIDLNHDGINDFQMVLKHSSHCNPFTCSLTYQSGFLSVYGLNGNEVFGQGTSASALPNHFQIGSKGNFPGGKKMLEMLQRAGGDSGSYRLFGPWKGKKLGFGSLSSLNNRYLGFKFEINGETHFGWARLDVSAAYGALITATLTGYAYETVPDKTILTLGFTITENRDPMKSDEQSASLQRDSNLPTLGPLALGAPAVNGSR